MNSNPATPAHGGHFGCGAAGRLGRHIRRLVSKSRAVTGRELSFLFFRHCGGHFQAIESMNVASATSFSLKPPASCVESTISTRL